MLRNETNDFFECTHNADARSCPKCKEIRAIISAKVPDYDPRRRASLRPDASEPVLTGQRRNARRVVERLARWRQEQRDDAGHGGTRATVEYMRIRGTRQVRIYRKFGDAGERISRAEARELERRGARVVRTVGIARSESPMYRLLGLLLNTLYTELIPGYRTGKQRPGLRRGEWSRNLAWARGRVRRAGARVGRARIPNRAGATFRELVRGLSACRACHAPILAGCWLYGEQITRRRLYCDERCKMRVYRGATVPASSLSRPER